MNKTRQTIGGLGNLMFKNAYLWAQMREGNIPDIYLQSEKYFSKYEHEIRQLYGQGIGSVDMVSLHIRRGDYLKNNFYVDLWQTDYYKRAIEMFPGWKFLVFCRDRQANEKDGADRAWCEENLPLLVGNRWELAWNEDETDDLNMMASCKHNIMANSSFSWWASWLNPNPEKKIICPKQWFSDGVERTEIPPTWTRI